MEVEVLFRDDPGHVGFGETVSDEKGFAVRLTEFSDDLIGNLCVGRRLRLVGLAGHIRQDS